MQTDKPQHIVWLAATFVLAIFVVGAHNIVTPEEPVRTGYTEIETECRGIEASICLGFQQRVGETFNYNDYQVPKEGSENYYRRVESELMLDAYKICERDNVSGKEWIPHSEYRNMTGDEWLETGNVSLLECEKIPFRDISVT